MWYHHEATFLTFYSKFCNLSCAVFSFSWHLRSVIPIAFSPCELLAGWWALPDLLSGKLPHEAITGPTPKRLPTSNFQDNHPPFGPLLARGSFLIHPTSKKDLQTRDTHFMDPSVSVLHAILLYCLKLFQTSKRLNNGNFGTFQSSINLVRPGNGKCRILFPFQKLSPVWARPTSCSI